MICVIAQMICELMKLTNHRGRTSLMNFGPGALCSTPCVGVKWLMRPQPLEDEGCEPRGGLAVCSAATVRTELVMCALHRSHAP